MNCKGCMTICGTANKPKDPEKCAGFIPRTNGNLLRSMPDEDLAETFAGRCCPIKDAFYACRFSGMEQCKQCWLDWLKSQAEEGE